MKPEDEALLRKLLAWSKENDPDENRVSMRAFRDMIERGYPLSHAQRFWARRLLESLTGQPQYENAWSEGQVPRGREVPTPRVLQHLPKSPPRRRPEEP